MKAIAIAPQSSTLKQIALMLFVLAAIVVGTSMESQADRFWRSNRSRTTGFNSSFGTGQTSSYRPSASIPKPVTGYGANIHRNFNIRQQQLRSQAGGSLIYRGNILWRR